MLKFTAMPDQRGEVVELVAYHMFKSFALKNDTVTEAVSVSSDDL